MEWVENLSVSWVCVDDIVDFLDDCETDVLMLMVAMQRRWR